MMKRCWIALLCALLLMGTTPAMARENYAEPTPFTYPAVTAAPYIPGGDDDLYGSGLGLRISPEALIGNTLVFGHYEQDGNFRTPAEPVEWIVLDVNEKNQALLISKYALDMQRFNGEWIQVNWRDCDLRQWLNTTFFRSCFARDELDVLVPVRNVSRWVDSTVATTDRLFCLSAEEVRKYFLTNADRQGIATGYAISAETAVVNGHCYWWLRDSTNRKSDANRIAPDGTVQEYGANTNALGVGVRPAMWVQLDRLTLDITGMPLVVTAQ